MRRCVFVALWMLSGCSTCDAPSHDDAGASRDMGVSADAGEACTAVLLPVDTDAFALRAGVELTKLSVFDDAYGALVGVYSMRVEGGVEITTVNFGRIDEPDAPVLRQVGDVIDTEDLLGVFEEGERVRFMTREPDGRIAIRDVGDAAFERSVLFDWRDPTTTVQLSYLVPCTGGRAFFANIAGSEEDRPVGLVFGRETESGVSIERTTLGDYTTLQACVALADGRIVGFGRDYARRLVTLVWNDDGDAMPDESLTGDYDARAGTAVLDDAAPFSPMFVDGDLQRTQLSRLDGLQLERVTNNESWFPQNGFARFCDAFVRRGGVVELLMAWQGVDNINGEYVETEARTYSVEFTAPSTISAPRLVAPARCSGGVIRENALYLPNVIGGRELSLVRECRE